MMNPQKFHLLFLQPAPILPVNHANGFVFSEFFRISPTIAMPMPSAVGTKTKLQMSNAVIFPLPFLCCTPIRQTMEGKGSMFFAKN